MKRSVLCAGVIVALAVGLSLARAQGATWQGVDETVVEKYATAAGRPPHPPLIDPGEGDLLLFVFLVAGAVGGFVAGYCFRELFPPKPKPGVRSR
jgi:ABC-type cobalt transport system substrate-binding protein